MRAARGPQRMCPYTQLTCQHTHPTARDKQHALWCVVQRVCAWRARKGHVRVEDEDGALLGLAEILEHAVEIEAHRLVPPVPPHPRTSVHASQRGCTRRMTTDPLHHHRLLALDACRPSSTSTQGHTQTWQHKRQQHQRQRHSHGTASTPRPGRKQRAHDVRTVPSLMATPVARSEGAQGAKGGGKRRSGPC